jgi:ABC-type uncharacterized transport system substrate-binding protein
MLKRLIPLMVIALLVTCFVEPAMGAGKVLIVQSYHNGYAWVDDIDQGIVKGLEGSGIETKTFYMDTKRKTSEAWKVESGKLAMQEVQTFKPDVIITADDNAQKYFAAELAGKADAPQVVFCGVNADPADYGFPATNVSGVIERPHFAQTIDLFQKINPAAKNITMICDDSITSKMTMKFCQTVKTPLPVIAYENPSTFEQWKAAVNNAQDKADAIIMFNYHTVKANADDEQSLAPKDVMDWTVQNSKIPVIHLLNFGVGDGALCGIAEDGREHGFLAAKTARTIIESNKKAGEFPVCRTHQGIVMLNLKTAQQLQIKIPYALIKTAQYIVK